MITREGSGPVPSVLGAKLQCCLHRPIPPLQHLRRLVLSSLLFVHEEVEALLER